MWKQVRLSFPQLGLIALTRGMLGAGIGLLVSDHLNPEQRRAAGWTLVGVGLVTTVPLVAEVVMKRKRHGPRHHRRHLRRHAREHEELAVVP